MAGCSPTSGWRTGRSGTRCWLPRATPSSSRSRPTSPMRACSACWSPRHGAGTACCGPRRRTRWTTGSQPAPQNERTACRPGGPGSPPTTGPHSGRRGRRNANLLPAPPVSSRPKPTASAVLRAEVADSGRPPAPRADQFRVRVTDSTVSFRFVPCSIPNRYQPKYQIRSTRSMSDGAALAVPRSAGGTIGQGGGHGLLLAVPDQLERDPVPRLVVADPADQVVLSRHGLAVQLDDQVADLEAGLGGRGARRDVLDERAAPSELIALLMPMTRPSRSASTPPELPGLMGASVWMTSRPPRTFEMMRLVALTIP